LKQGSVNICGVICDLLQKASMDNYIARLAANNPTLTTLDIGLNSIDDAGASALAEALLENITLTTLNIPVNNIRADGARALATALQQNATLTTLNISGNRIGDAGASALAEALLENTTLTTLNIPFNNIHADGARALATALQQNATLTTLNISGNRIGDDGVRALAGALRQNRTLAVLDLSNQYISDAGLHTLADAIRQNGMIHTIELGNHNYPPLTRYLERNKRGQENARKVVIAVLGAFKKLEKTDMAFREETEHILNWFLTKGWFDTATEKQFLQVGKSALPTLRNTIASQIWRSRGDPKWWTAEEQREAGLEPTPKKGRMELESCIQCRMEARFHELEAPKQLFCGSYCQWLKYSGAPDLRGKSPEQTIHLLKQYLAIM
jgi:hypothetical protein